MSPTRSSTCRCAGMPLLALITDFLAAPTAAYAMMDKQSAPKASRIISNLRICETRSARRFLRGPAGAAGVLNGYIIDRFRQSVTLDQGLPQVEQGVEFVGAMARLQCVRRRAVLVQQHHMCESVSICAHQPLKRESAHRSPGPSILITAAIMRYCRRYGTTTALARSTRTSAVSPTRVTPVAPDSPSFTTRTSARLLSTVSSVTR
jgi:hypothetical protein